MNKRIRTYSPDKVDDASGLGAGTSTDEQSVTSAHEGEWRGDNDMESANQLTDTKLNAKANGGDQANARVAIRPSWGLADWPVVCQAMVSAPMNTMLPSWDWMINRSSQLFITEK